ncbi:uncharacterized protein [Gossypium hirsutum]|uniref:Myb/SANT-like domain-containing protein n=1 Tax=Gossypium hirsutum TaxID=3635 RepID=A0ABM3AZL8_GOSHI|nr:uncharacterized protein LOC107911153 [Gossypium hirsutum]
MAIGRSATAVAPPWTMAGVAQKKRLSFASQRTRKLDPPSLKKMKKEGSFAPLPVRFQHRRWSPATGFRDRHLMGDGGWDRDGDRRAVVAVEDGRYKMLTKTNRVVADEVESNGRASNQEVSQSKYYLADAGYGIRIGCITPYRGVRYHLKEFGAEGPKNAKELFNLRHSSLRITVELTDAISERFQVQCDAKHVENHLRTVKNQWQIICKIRGESGFGWDDSMKMITCDRATYDAAVMAHKKYEPFLNKSIDYYDEMALVVGKDMATGSFAITFADIDLDDGNENSMPVDCDNEEAEEVRTNVSSSGTSKRKRKSGQESVVDEQIKFVGEQLGKIANALDQFTADKTSQLYKQVMSIEEEGFDDDFLCSVFDYLVSHESEAKAFSVKSKNHRKIWLQKFFQG